MENKKLTVGIVGFGGAGIAQYHHFQHIKGCKVIAVYDTENAAFERARKFDPSLFCTEDYQAFLNCDIDIVAICSPDRTHAEYMVKAITAGKHTICEKPLTDSMEGYQNIIVAERRNPGVVAAVQHQMRFLTVHNKMKTIIQSGELGAIAYLEGYYIHNLTVRASKYHHWRFTDNATPTVYSGCHFVDLLRWFLDDEVEVVQAMANNVAFPEYPESDMNILLMKFRSGIIGKVITAFGAGRPQDHSVRVYGSKKSIENNILFDKNGTYRIFARPFLNTLRYRVGIRSTLKELGAIISGRTMELLMKAMPLRGEYGISTYPIRLYEHAYAVHQSLLDFVNAIRTGRQPLCTVVDSAKTVATSLAGVEAYRTGKPVKVEKYWIPEFEQ